MTIIWIDNIIKEVTIKGDWIFIDFADANLNDLGIQIQLASTRNNIKKIKEGLKL